MSNQLRVTIDIDYDDNVREIDRLYVDKLVDRLLTHVEFGTPTNALDDCPDPVRVGVEVVKDETRETAI